MKKFWILLLAALLFHCNPSVRSTLWNYTPEDTPPAYEHADNPCCRDKLNYAPDTNHLEHTPIKYVRLNFHIMNSSDSSRNFGEEEGVKFVRELLKYAHKSLENNEKMFLPPGNDTPVLPTRYRYVLTPRPDDPHDDGIYFHYDDELYFYVVRGKHRNNFRREVVRKYGVQLDTVLNVFLMPHHPDSVASPTYGAYGAGIALGNAVKITGCYEIGTPPWGIRGTFNHEIGHIFGLRHTWSGDDGCADTPNHPGCWSRTPDPPCDSLASNNLMDHNAWQNAWTPCQIATIHYNMARERTRVRKLLLPRWCELHDDQHIVVRDSVHWKSMKDLEGHLTVAEGGVLRISCRVSLPRGARITVQPGGKLILDNCRLHNACGDTWQGIFVQKRGKREGQVVVVGNPRLENLHPG